MVEDQAAADAGAEEEVGEVRHAFAHAGPAFADRGGGGVVVERHRQVGGLAQHGLQGHPCPVGELRRVDHHAELVVDRARSGESQSQYLAAWNLRFVECIGHQLGHGGHDV